MRLYLVRHAEAAPGHPDEIRPLTPAGREHAAALGTELARGPALDAVLSSPLLRARQTADAVAAATGLTVVIDERLAPGATAEDVLAVVAGRGEHVVVVGHQPDCTDVALALTGGPPLAFAPGSVHAIDVDRA